MKAKWQITVLISVIVFSVNSYVESAENANSIQAPYDLITVIYQIPSDINKIDNITIRLLRSKVAPQDATDCMKAIPRLLESNDFKKMEEFDGSHKLTNLIIFFDQIYGTVKIDEYLKVCASLKNRSANHRYIYTLVNQSLRKNTRPIRELYIPQIINLLPLSPPNNSLIISSLYLNLSEEQWLIVISELKKRYADNQAFVDEIEATQKNILHNENYKSKNTNVQVSP